MIIGESCPMCGGPGTASEYGAGLRECCGCLLSWEWPSEAAYEAWYRGEGYHGAHQAEEGLPVTEQRDTEHQAAATCRLRTMAALELSGTLLDVGAAMGSFVAAAAAFGWNAVGIEPSESMVARAQNLGRPVQTGSVADLPSTAFDVVTCFDVIEHLTRPRQALLAMRSRLKSGGCLVVEMPEYLGLAGDWMRHIRPRQHVCLYSESAAREMFRQCGLTTETLIRPKRGTIAKAAYYLRAD